MSNKLPEDVVVVIDSTLSRAEAMARPFRKAGCKVIRFFDDDGNIQQSIATEKQLKCLIKLWHFGDLEQKRPTVAATLTVYYGGHGGNDPRPKPEESGERIWRRVGTEENVLTDVEAKELVAYAKGMLNDTQPEHSSKPAFLSLPKQVRLLSTLAVLCKGYLAVYAAADAMKEYGVATNFQLSDIKDALNEIGWDELQKDKEALQNMVGGLSEHVSLVQNSEWWRKPFLDEEKADSRLRNEQLGEFDDAIKEEWAQVNGIVRLATVNGQAPNAVVDKSFRPVQDLLNAIRQNNTKITPAVVASAYLALSKVLKSKGRI